MPPSLMNYSCLPSSYNTKHSGSFVHLYDLKLNIFVSFFSINISLVIIKFSEITQRFGILLI